MARARQAKLHVLRHVLDHGFLAHARQHRRHRKSLLTFVGPELMAVRLKQWRVYLTDVRPTGIGSQRLGGMFSANGMMAGYPKVYNIEMDPGEDLDVGGLFRWAAGPALKVVTEYEKSLKGHPNPPPPNVTNFGRGAP